MSGQTVKFAQRRLVRLSGRIVRTRTYDSRMTVSRWESGERPVTRAGVVRVGRS